MIEYPAIPESITIHLGAPSDSSALNVTESFADYIKNVASSEIYPTWPEEALKANILAQISVALNRVYTEHYRSAGRDFDITSSPAYDQNYVYERDIYDNISRIVDDLFTSYIRRTGTIEPLYAEFCDGINVTCNGLYQWGSVELANQGKSYIDILKQYYGDDIEIVTDVPVENSGESAPSPPLDEGDTRRLVEILQRRLNRISANFPRIPKIYPPDGFFGAGTTDAVKLFQETFGLTPDGIVGKATWYKVRQIYNAVTRISSIQSEGLTFEDVATQYSDRLQLGDISNGVLALQYYLSYIANFLPSVLPALPDAQFGPDTKKSVLSYQRTYGLPETGVVDRAVWESIENAYLGFASAVDYSFSPGVLLPFPGEVLTLGASGEAVRVMQTYLNYIADVYTSIPKIEADGIFGPRTAEAVNAFKDQFGINNENTAPEEPRVTVRVWNSIVKVYDDLYTANIVNEGQYPGYDIS